MTETIPANTAIGIPEQQRLDEPYQQCGGCHGEDSALPGGNLLENFDTGGTKHDSTASVSPDSKAQIACMACHEWHASSLTKLLETTIAGSPITDNDNQVCYACHKVPGISRYADIVSYDTSPGDIHGATDSTETSGAPGLISPYKYRQPQILCNDCHSPHGTGNVAWIRESINSTGNISIDGTEATDRPDWEGMCATCHTYSHDSTTAYDRCVTCHFHGAGSDADSTTTF